MTDNVNGQRQNSTTTMNNGSYSPAEASIAPIVPIVSNIIHTPLDIPIPTVYYENVENLLKKFQQHIKESIDLDKFITDNVELINKPNNDSNSNQDSNHTTTTNRNNDLRELIKKISELIWSNLHRSHYKDRAHLQTIYSYVSENKLDCYGVAYTVLAACQILGLDDVRLVMSEDHAWVTFGQGETCEVTWHGKCGNDDRCGQSIPTTMESLNCWLYLNGNTMTCDRFQTIGTLVSAMNLSINATQDSEELAILQQHLLWILYDFGYLERYPMALGNLGDIEDVCSIHSTTARKHPLELFNEAIESARKYYNDYHVYPYTYLGGYYFRKRQFKQAFRAWADAARVVMKYNYTRDDEEIYKEFQEISNDLIPYIVKYSTSTAIAADGNDDTGNRIDSIIDDPECFVYLLQFYDGLCAWEEDSTTPVLHIGWTKPIVSTISKFPYRTRSQIIIKVDPTLNIKHQFNHQSSLIGDVDHHHYHSDDLIENSENHNINIVSGNQHLIGRERRRRRAASIGQQPATPPLTAQSQVNIFNHGKRSSTGIGNTNRMFSTGKSSCGPFSEMDYILSSSTTTTNYGSKSTIANSPSSTCGGGQQIRTNQSSSNININQNSNNKRLRRE
ncbi:Menin [Dermatophagoides pteronyssinus]|uniref:Menin n=1 Tax=Dermatophagoides pteronyssinus TaxID=6956 RepID=A0ABQ8J7N7_DERPT|nr:Menin [Dermatophagoides pteronyssinus]